MIPANATIAVNSAFKMCVLRKDEREKPSTRHFSSARQGAKCVHHARRSLEPNAQPLCYDFRGFRVGNKPMNRLYAGGVLIALFASAAPSALAEMSAEELAKIAQNPVGNLISVPFQENANLNFGPEKGTQNVLNIQPVYPISVSDDWNIITRTILPIVTMPTLGPGTRAVTGLGNVQFTAFLSPANPGKWIWGVGPAAQLPTNSDPELGNKNPGLGPSFVVLRIERGSPWVYGALMNNIWSVTSSQQGGAYNNGLLQPFVNYNFA